MHIELAAGHFDAGILSLEFQLGVECKAPHKIAFRELFSLDIEQAKYLSNGVAGARCHDGRNRLKGEFLIVFYNRGDERFLGAEIFIHRPLGNARIFEYGIDPSGMEPLTIKNPIGAFNDLVALG